MAEYIPGVCNIGPAEIKARRNLGISWGIGTLGLFFLLYILNVDPLWRLVIFFPAVVAYSGIYQAQMKFCAGYGNSGLYNVAKSVGHYDTVEQAEFRKKDKKKAQQIFAYSLVSALAVAIIATFF